MGLTRERKVVVGDVRRFRGRPEKVAAVIEETARLDTRRVKIAMARDPGQAGIAQQEFYVRRLNGYVLDFSPESGDKQTRAKPFAVQVNNHNVEMIKGDWNAAYREELRSFPFGKHDDMTDASSRAHMVLTSSRAPMRISQAAVDRAGMPSRPPLIAFDSGRTYRGRW
jgi:predicted phage terminase large subunit-like protein